MIIAQTCLKTHFRHEYLSNEDQQKQSWPKIALRTPNKNLQFVLVKKTAVEVSLFPLFTFSAFISLSSWPDASKMFCRVILADFFDKRISMPLLQNSSIFHGNLNSQLMNDDVMILFRKGQSWFYKFSASIARLFFRSQYIIESIVQYNICSQIEISFKLLFKHWCSVNW